MTWAKTGSEFPLDAYNVELSDAAYRTHHEAITYLFTLERMDCYVRADEVRRFCGSAHAEMAVQELVGQGWWAIQDKGYRIVHHANVIRSGITAQAKKKARDKRSQKAWRDRQVGDDVSADVSADADRQTDRQAGIEVSDQVGTGW